MAVDGFHRASASREFPFAHRATFFVIYQKLYQFERTTDDGMIAWTRLD
jgi:hypothetical protein